MNPATDLDKSGFGYQKVRVYKGPSLGWVETLIKPANVCNGPVYYVQAGDSIIFAQTAVFAPIIYLPDVILWIQETAYQPATGFERAVWIKDISGNASANPITVQPFGGQRIDNLTVAFQIVQNRQLIRLYPIIEQATAGFAGWFVG